MVNYDWPRREKQEQRVSIAAPCGSKSSSERLCLFTGKSFLFIFLFLFILSPNLICVVFLQYIIIKVTLKAIVNVRCTCLKSKGKKFLGEPVSLRHWIFCSFRIRHRGPDWSGCYTTGNHIVCHERLAIVGVGKAIHKKLLISVEAIHNVWCKIRTITRYWCSAPDQRRREHCVVRQWRDL